MKKPDGRCEWCTHSSHGGDLSAPSEVWLWMSCSKHRRMTPRDSVCEAYQREPGADDEEGAV